MNRRESFRSLLVLPLFAVQDPTRVENVVVNPGETVTIRFDGPYVVTRDDG